MFADPEEVERYLHEHIPITRAMEVRVREVGAAGVRLWAPLSANINHRSTVFGGSASTLAILSAWTLVHVGLRERAYPSRIVIQRNSVEYLRPMTGDFEAFCAFPPPPAWQRFLDTLARRSRGRIVLAAELLSGGERCGAFEGVYVASRAPSPGGAEHGS